MIRHFWNQNDLYFLSSEDKVVKVETLQVLYFASTNYSFASAQFDNERFSAMFLDC